MASRTSDRRCPGLREECALKRRHLTRCRSRPQPCSTEQVFDRVEEWKSPSITVRRFVQLHQPEQRGRTAVVDPQCPTRHCAMCLLSWVNASSPSPSPGSGPCRSLRRSASCFPTVSSAARSCHVEVRRRGRWRSGWRARHWSKVDGWQSSMFRRSEPMLRRSSASHSNEWSGSTPASMPMSRQGSDSTGSM